MIYLAAITGFFTVVLVNWLISGKVSDYAYAVGLWWGLIMAINAAVKEIKSKG